jgi:hypothetical protein
VTDYPTPAIASRIKTARMAGFLIRHNYTGRIPAQVLAERMRANPLSTSPGTVAGKSFSAQSFTRLLQLLNTQLADYDDAIASAVAEHPDAPIFASFLASARCSPVRCPPKSAKTATDSRPARYCSPKPPWRR